MGVEHHAGVGFSMAGIVNIVTIPILGFVSSIINDDFHIDDLDAVCAAAVVTQACFQSCLQSQIVLASAKQVCEE